jgi:environmental stress-induced protein Ves
MPLLLFPPSSYKQMPWKNGLGVTTELARFPEGDAPFDWRVSIAKVDRDGPFSPFPGIDRAFLVLEGEGIRLVRPSSTTQLRRFEPFSFPGDDETIGELLAGPIRDFNVMTRRTVAESRLTIVRGPAPTPLEAGDALVLTYCASGTARVVRQDEKVHLPAGSTVIAASPAGLVRIEPASPDSILVVASIRLLPRH